MRRWLAQRLNHGLLGECGKTLQVKLAITEQIAEGGQATEVMADAEFLRHADAAM